LQLGLDRTGIERQLTEPKHAVVIRGAELHNVAIRATKRNLGAGGRQQSPVSRYQRYCSSNLAGRLRGEAGGARQGCERHHRRRHGG